MGHAFDTLRYSQRLQQVGVPREQAEAQAELARDMLLDQVATKDDLDALGKELKGEIVAVAREAKADVVAQTKELRSDLAAQAKEISARAGDLKLDIEGLRSEVKTLAKDLRTEAATTKAEAQADLKLLEHRMTIKLGLMLVGTVGIAAALLRLVL